MYAHINQLKQGYERNSILLYDVCCWTKVNHVKGNVTHPIEYFITGAQWLNNSPIHKKRTF